MARKGCPYPPGPHAEPLQGQSPHPGALHWGRGNSAWCLPGTGCGVLCSRVEPHGGRGTLTQTQDSCDTPRSSPPPGRREAQPTFSSFLLLPFLSFPLPGSRRQTKSFSLLYLCRDSQVTKRHRADPSLPKTISPGAPWDEWRVGGWVSGEVPTLLGDAQWGWAVSEGERVTPGGDGGGGGTPRVPSAAAAAAPALSMVLGPPRAPTVPPPPGKEGAGRGTGGG